MDRKIIIFFILPSILFTHPYDERVAKLRVRANKAYLNRNWVIIVDVAYKLWKFGEKQEVGKVLKLAGKVIIVKRSIAGSLHMYNLYKLIGDLNNANKWKIIYRKILKNKEKRWKKL